MQYETPEINLVLHEETDIIRTSDPDNVEENPWG